MKSLILALAIISFPAIADCTPLGDGEFTSSSGASFSIWADHPDSPFPVTPQGCGGSTYLMGELGRDGISLPGLQAILPPGPIPGAKLAFSRYDEDDGSALFVAQFEESYGGRAVDITFRTSDVTEFTMHELVVYRNGFRSRSNILYHEHGTEWSFRAASSEESTISGIAWVDADQDGQRAPSEAREVGRVVTLYRCAPPWGIAGIAITQAPDGEFEFDDIPPGEYQMGTAQNTEFSPLMVGPADTDSDFYSNGFTSCYDFSEQQSLIGLGVY